MTDRAMLISVHTALRRSKERIAEIHSFCCVEEGMGMMGGEVVDGCEPGAWRWSMMGSLSRTVLGTLDNTGRPHMLGYSNDEVPQRFALCVQYMNRAEERLADLERLSFEAVWFVPQDYLTNDYETSFARAHKIYDIAIEMAYRDMILCQGAM